MTRRAAAFVALWLLAVPLAATELPHDSDVKAVYLLQFGRFASWPAPERDANPFTLCVLGRDPFNGVLDSAIAGEQIDGRPVVARRLSNLQDAMRCHIVFIGDSEAPRIQQIIRELSASPVLTVSDLPNFVDGEGMIQFVRQGSRVRFSVNTRAAARAGLSLSSEMLRVALSVTGIRR